MNLTELIERLQKISEKNSNPKNPMPVVLWSAKGFDYRQFIIGDVSCENETAYIKIEEEEE